MHEHGGGTPEHANHYLLDCAGADTSVPDDRLYGGRQMTQAERVTFEGFEGVGLIADVRGPADGWPVLLLHGGGQTRHAWGSTAERVAAKGWRTVALDLRGHGDSDWAPNGDYSFTAFSADIWPSPTNSAARPCWWGPPSAGWRPCWPRAPATGPISAGRAGRHHPQGQPQRDRAHP